MSSTRLLGNILVGGRKQLRIQSTIYRRLPVKWVTLMTDKEVEECLAQKQAASRLQQRIANGTVLTFIET